MVLELYSLVFRWKILHFYLSLKEVIFLLASVLTSKETKVICFNIFWGEERVDDPPLLNSPSGKKHVKS